MAAGILVRSSLNVVVRRCTSLYVVVRRCTSLYVVVRRCTSLYAPRRFNQCCAVDSLLRRCTSLYVVVRRCTSLYVVVCSSSLQSKCCAVDSLLRCCCCVLCVNQCTSAVYRYHNGRDFEILAFVRSFGCRGLVQWCSGAVSVKAHVTDREILMQMPAGRSDVLDAGASIQK